MRAVKGLEKDKRLTLTRRRLVSFEECVAHYPNKTLLSHIRNLRLKLLPALLRWTQEDNALPRYNLAENESFYLNSLTQDDRNKLRKAWQSLEPRLIDLLPRSEHAARNALFSLIAKGKSIFETQDLQCWGAFAEHVHRCIDQHLLPEAVASDAKCLSDAILPAPDAGHLRLRSYIHTFAEMPRHRRCSLKQQPQ
jgi:hypothetical protein